MGVIEIPGYSALIDNHIYRKNRDFFGLGGKESLMSMERYRVPNMDEVMNYISGCVDAVERGEGRDKSSTMNSLSIIPRGKIRAIVPGKEEMREIMKNDPLRKYEPNSWHYRVWNGEVSRQEIQKARDKATQDGARAYLNSMHTKGENLFYCDMLIRDGKLPENWELEYLMNVRTRDCDVFKTKINLEDYPRVVKLVRTLKDQLNNSERMGMVYDDSFGYMDARAVEVLTTTLLKRLGIPGMGDGMPMGIPMGVPIGIALVEMSEGMPGMMPGFGEGDSRKPWEYPHSGN